MEAIRQTVKVKNHQINITLPDHFDADEVDVIILPSVREYQIPQWQMDEVRERTIAYDEKKSIALEVDSALESILEERSKEDKSTFISSEESIKRLKERKRV